MTSLLLFPRHLTLPIGLFTVLTGLAVIGCTRIHYLYPKNLQGFSLPPGCPAGSPPANGSQLAACLNGIEFDTTEFVGDEQRLMVRDSAPGTAPACFADSAYTCRYGPLAKVEPVKGAELYNDSSLTEGRIIARIYLREGETESYAKFQLAPGDTTYWWVKIKPDTSVFVRRVTGMVALAAKRKGLKRTPHPRGSFQQGFIRWVWDPKDETLNGGCGPSCCKPR
jgi:hypothetical protein